MFPSSVSISNIWLLSKKKISWSMVSFLNRKCGCRCGWGGRLRLSVDEMRDYVLFCFSLQNEYFFHLLSQVLKLYHWELFCFLLGFFEEEGVFSTQLQTTSVLNSILNSTQQPRCCLCINYETVICMDILQEINWHCCMEFIRPEQTNSQSRLARVYTWSLRRNY